MSDLPNSLNPSTIRALSVPGDMTIAETLAFIYSQPEYRHLTGRLKAQRIRFLDPKGRDINPDTPMSVVRLLIRQRRASCVIEIADGGGVIHLMEPVPC